ncbi:MAG TPA: NAD(P)(+) transhydrogenase (Re/Si-specific) subunit alpha, partial [Vicinamibacteria bacterium]
NVLGPLNLAATVPFHASQLYAKNGVTLLLSLVKNGALVLDPADEIVRETLVIRDGQVLNQRVREALGLPLLYPAAPA